jgi:hypothetical protein
MTLFAQIRKQKYLREINIFVDPSRNQHQYNMRNASMFDGLTQGETESFWQNKNFNRIREVSHELMLTWSVY